MISSKVLGPITFGVAAASALLAVYFLILTLVSDWSFARAQFSQFWYFIVSLAVGFGIQIGLYTYLRRAIHPAPFGNKQTSLILSNSTRTQSDERYGAGAMHQKAPGRTVAVTGTTSTVAMVSPHQKLRFGTGLRTEFGASTNVRAVPVTTGITSTGAMLACCAHYVANIVPILGIAGALTLIGQYQKELFWVGLAFNFAGIAYIASKVFQFKRHATMSSRT